MYTYDYNDFADKILTISRLIYSFFPTSIMYWYNFAANLSYYTLLSWLTPQTIAVWPTIIHIISPLNCIHSLKKRRQLSCVSNCQDSEYFVYKSWTLIHKIFSLLHRWLTLLHAYIIFGRPAKNFKEIFLRTLIRIKHSLYCSQLCIITRQVKSLRHNTYRTDR